MKIQALIYDGFDELDIIGIYEPLRMAGFAVDLVSTDTQDTVEAAYGLKIKADGVLSLDNKPDLLLVPGGGWVNRASKGAWSEAKNEKLLDLLKSFYKARVIIASVCTGAFLLAKAGLLTGRTSTTNQQAVEELSGMGVKVIDARVVDDGRIITAGGITSSLDLGLWLIERFAGQERAKEISKRLEFEARGPVWQKDTK